MMEKIAYCYLVRCKDNSLYTGMTRNIDKRMEEHKGHHGSIGAKYIRSHGFDRLAYLEIFNTASEARRREIEIKTRDKIYKQKLVDSLNNIVHKLDLNKPVIEQLKQMGVVK